jgi:hypothetical protein
VKKTKYLAVTMAVALTFAVRVSAQTAQTEDVTVLETSSAVAPGSPTTANVPGAGTTGFPSATTYSVTYDGEVTSITGFTGGSGATTVNYAPLAYSGTITTTLESVTGSTVSTAPENNVLYNNVVSSSGTSYTVAGPYIGNEATAFNANNFNVGTDNIFGNQGDTNGNNNNIERVDVVFSSGLTANSALAFAVFERGATNAHDTFQIAAITSVDGSGNPTGFGQLVSFGAGTSYGSYGQTALSGYSGDTTNWLVSRNATNGSGLAATDPSTTVAGQSIGGVTISVTQSGSSGLGIANGTTIYGYALFGDDVPANSTSAELLDLTDTTTYPQNTSSNTGAGGIDLLAYTGVAFTAVPEPRDYAFYMLAGASLLMVGRRFARRNAS